MSMMLKSLPLIIFLTLTACTAMPAKPISTVNYVDLRRFMGDWYVIANIPTFIEREAYNAVESYELNEEGHIETTFSFNKGGFDGDRKVYEPTGYVKDEASNAVWGMQFIWPFKADYRIVYLNDDYSVTVIGRNKRDYVWIMARQPTIPAGLYTELLAMLETEGYDISQIQKVPQQW
ncbi:MAG: lipocalin family protein [Gammaproteobacteria bacterium]